MWTAGWLGLGTAYLLGRTRFGYSFALCLFLAGLFTFLVRNKPEYAGAGALPLLYFIAAGLLALAVAVETYFANDRWPILAAVAVVGATLLSIVLMATTTLAAPGYALDPTTAAPVATLFPPSLRLLTPFMNITGAFALILGAIFSTYVFMPKRRVLAYSLDPNQPGDEFLFNLLIAPVAIAVNLVASLPGAVRALSEASSALARGELMQRADAWSSHVTPERYLERCRLKTASLFSASCRLGALFGGKPAMAEELGRFGESVGLAFQMLDDVLDVSGPSERTGKPRGTDLLDGTVTLPLILARASDPSLRELSAELTAEQAESVCDRIAATGALEAARDQALTHVAEAKRSLAQLDLPAHRREALELVADGVVERYA